jgi:hypothetical protein
MSIWVYCGYVPSGTIVTIDLVGSTTVIANGASSGFTASADGGFPPSQYVFFNRTPNPISGEYERNICGTVVISTYTFVAAAVAMSNNLGGGVELQITRIA